MSTLPERQHAVNEAAVPAAAPEGAPATRSPAGDAFSGLVVRLFRLNGLLDSEGDRLARPAGQTAARWQVLAMVEDAPRTVAEIARTLGLTRQSVQRVADALEAAGLAAYEDNPRHRRARLLDLTPKGRSTLGSIQARQRPWADELGAGVGERELARANAVLDRVLAVLAARRQR